MPLGETLSKYYRLSKPGIVYGNMIAAVAGFFFASRGYIDWVSFAALLGGLSLVIASASAFNNVLDKNIDAKMERTKKRAVAAGTISTSNALIYASVVLGVGVAILALWTNQVTVAVALFGHFAYVVLYGVGKRKTVHGTLIGTISGSTPPVIGYAAVTGNIDLAAILLFLILVAWQMPHFYAIALFRKQDYAQAGIPVLPIVKGDHATRREMLVYIGLYVVSVLLLGAFGGASLFTTLVLVLVGFYWYYATLTFIPADGFVPWARRNFRLSLVILLIVSIMLSVDFIFH